MRVPVSSIVVMFSFISAWTKARKSRSLIGSKPQGPSVAPTQRAPPQQMDLSLSLSSLPEILDAWPHAHRADCFQRQEHETKLYSSVGRRLILEKREEPSGSAVHEPRKSLLKSARNPAQVGVAQSAYQDLFKRDVPIRNGCVVLLSN